MQILPVVLAIFLAGAVQYVDASDNLVAVSLLSTKNDPCGVHIVSCNPSGTTASRSIILTSAIFSFVMLFFPILRIRQLQPGPSEDNTLFWWFLCLGSAGFMPWCFYFSACHSWHGSVFPLFVVSIIGVVVHFVLTRAASYVTPTPKEVWRVIFLFGVPVAGFIVAFVLKVTVSVQYVGWLGLGLTCLSHSFRFASSITYLKTFSTSLVFASVLGAIGGFLWLADPELCVSREYKITCYVVAVMRVTEAIIMCCHAIARLLWRIEGYAIQPAPVGNGLP